ncbi:MAG: hypothetical protein ABI910_21905 [Gemmatimonadota bacterium]
MSRPSAGYPAASMLTETFTLHARRRVADPAIEVGRDRDIARVDLDDRYDTSREHLVGLLPRLSGLSVSDNSAEHYPNMDESPAPLLLLQTDEGAIVRLAPKHRIAALARPVLAAAAGAIT